MKKRFVVAPVLLDQSITMKTLAVTGMFSLAPSRVEGATFGSRHAFRRSIGRLPPLPRFGDVSSSRGLQIPRGGSQVPSDPYAPPPYGYPSTQSPQDPSNEFVEEDPFHETVQSRVDTWRTQQREYAEATRTSPRDEQGRMKLLTSVSKGSRAVIFFILMFRNIHLYEVADQTHKGLVRIFCVVPLAFLFIANLAGVVSSLTSPSHSAKKRLKAILNLDKFLELCLIVFYFVRLTFLPSKYTPREMYIANTFHSLFFLIQCQAFTRLSWDESAAAPIGSYVQPNVNEEEDDHYARRQGQYYSPPPPAGQYHKQW